MAMWFTRREVIVAGAGVLAGLIPLHGATPASAPQRAPLVGCRNPRRYRVEHNAVVTAGDLELSRLEIWVPVPQESPAQQIIGLRTEPRVRVYEAKSRQARIAKLYLERRWLPGPTEDRALKVAYDVICRETIVDRGRLMRLPYQPYRHDPVYRRFTQPEKGIETQATGIAEQAKKLAGESRPAAHVARDAYEWVLDRTRYKEIDGLGGAEYCYTNAHGECGDYSALFVALCRGAGVPARPVVGFWADGKDRWHVWAEFMLPGGQWIPVDPQIGDQNAFSREHCFGYLDNRRVALCRTFQVELLDCKRGRNEASFVQMGVFWWRTDNLTPSATRPAGTFTVLGKPVAGPLQSPPAAR